jgi:hypothetical protein
MDLQGALRSASVQGRRDPRDFGMAKVRRMALIRALDAAGEVGIGDGRH